MTLKHDPVIADLNRYLDDLDRLEAIVNYKDDWLYPLVDTIREVVDEIKPKNNYVTQRVLLDRARLAFDDLLSGINKFWGDND